MTNFLRISTRLSGLLIWNCYMTTPRKHFSYRFDSMTNSHNEFMLFSHIGDEFIWSKSLIKCFAEHFRSTIQCTTKTITLKKNIYFQYDQFNILDYIKSILYNRRGWWKFRLRHMVKYIFKTHFFPVLSLYQLNQNLVCYLITGLPRPISVGIPYMKICLVHRALLELFSHVSYHEKMHQLALC